MQRKLVVSNNELFESIEREIASGKSIVLRTKGRSMLPFFRGERDSVELSPVVGEVVCGQIYLAKINHPVTRYVIHRVICLDGETVTLMGDGNIVGTESCDCSGIIAQVTKIIKPNRRVDPASRSQRLYSSLWQMVVPLRRWILKLL